MIRSVALALALVLLAGGAHAQPPDAAKADALFKEGRALMKKGDFETACPKLEESYRLDPAAGTGINLGDCFEKQGKIASALLAYQAARALLKPGDPRIGPVEKGIAALDKRAPRLTIKLAPGAPEGTTVKRDGREMEPGTPAVVNPGKHVIIVSAAGMADARYTVRLVEAESRVLTLEVGASTGQDAPTEQNRDPGRVRNPLKGEERSSGSTKDVGYVLGGIGLLGVLVAVPSYIYVSNKAADARDGVEGASEDGKAIAPLFYGATGVAVVGIGLGGYLLLASRDESDTRVAIQALPDRASVALWTRF